MIYSFGKGGLFGYEIFFICVFRGKIKGVNNGLNLIDFGVNKRCVYIDNIYIYLFGFVCINFGKIKSKCIVRDFGKRMRIKRYGGRVFFYCCIYVFRNLYCLIMCLFCFYNNNNNKN